MPASVSKCTVPRWLTEVVETITPFCATCRPTSETSPVVAMIRPLLVTDPAPAATVTSVPSVVEVRLPLSVPSAFWVTL